MIFSCSSKKKKRYVMLLHCAGRKNVDLVTVSGVLPLLLPVACNEVWRKSGAL